VELGAIALLVAAAVMHSTWNLLAKRSLDKQVFLWLAMCACSLFFLVPVLYIWQPVKPAAWLLILLSGVFEAVYYTVLGKAYQSYDLSLIYPLARGSAPLFVVVLAFVFLRESIPASGAAGILLIVTGIYTLHIKRLSREGLVAPLIGMREHNSRIGLLCGLSIACYSVVDKAGVALVRPEQYIYLVFLASCVFLAPRMLIHRRPQINVEWSRNAPRVLVTAILNLGAYFLVLVAMTQTKVSYVSGVREMSIVLGALMGTLLLKEPFGKSKILGSVLIFCGILCISLLK